MMAAPFCGVMKASSDIASASDTGFLVRGWLMVSKICTLKERAASNRVLEAKADEAEKVCLLTVWGFTISFFLKMSLFQCSYVHVGSGVDRQEKQLIHRYMFSACM